MSFITLDFETYFDKVYTLSKLTLEEYINHERFEIIGVSVKVDNELPQWFSGTLEETENFLSHFNWSESALCCHNMLFDGAILAWRLGIIPAYYYDTLCMARALNGVDVGGSLKKLAEHYSLGVKGTEAQSNIGLRRQDFSPKRLQEYGAYCINDTILTFKLFNRMAADFPNDEYDLIDLTLRMFIQPRLGLDVTLLKDRLAYLRTTKDLALEGLMARLNCTDIEQVCKKLSSNVRFGQILNDLGVPIPMKISPATQKPTAAFAKTDEDFVALQSHSDPFVQQLCAVRLGTKSTMEESRVERFIDIAERNSGLLPVPLKYYGAHTGRWSGMDYVNLQNLPSRDKEKKALKNSLVAPEGYTITNSDSSQIEARILAWWAGQNDVVELFARGEDVYCADATKVFKRVITKADEKERFAGKEMRLSLGYGVGPLKLQRSLKSKPPYLEVLDDDCRQWVLDWRNANSLITDLWRSSDIALRDMMSWPQGKAWYWLGKEGVILVTPLGLKLPNDLFIRYPNLRTESSKNMGTRQVYDGRKGDVNIWGGAMVENVVQALARIIIGMQMVRISKRYRPILTVHDSIVNIIKDEELASAVAFIKEQMNWVPEWGGGLPITCEIKHGKSYGEC